MKLFLEGHSFDYIDSLTVPEVGDIIGYWSGNSKVQEKQAKKQKQAAQSKSRRKKR